MEDFSAHAVEVKALLGLAANNSLFDDDDDDDDDDEEGVHDYEGGI